MDSEMLRHLLTRNATSIVNTSKPVSGIRSAHVVAHDMGDSILTEMLAQYEKKLLPDAFNSFFKSVTFTNGGMRYSLINFRLSQAVQLFSAHL